jgi:hypothetical protein
MISTETIGQLSSLKQQNPKFLKELSRSRFLRLKDPACSNNINELPTKALKQVITPTVFQYDQQACNMILNRIEEDEIASEYRDHLK